MDAASKASDRGELAEACAALIGRYHQPVLVETYLPGREFTVGIVGTGDKARVIGVMEVSLRPGADADAYSWRNKEECESLVTYRRVKGAVAGQAGELALACWRGLECRDAGRVDLRCDAAGQPQFLEVNPLAGLHPEHSDLPILCSLVGLPYVKLIERIVASALERRAVLAPGGVSSPRGPRPGPGLALSASCGWWCCTTGRPRTPPRTRPTTWPRPARRPPAWRPWGTGPDSWPGEAPWPTPWPWLGAERPDAVFNLVEEPQGRASRIAAAPYLVARADLPLTGAGGRAMLLSSHKLLAKRLLRRAGLPTPAWREPKGRGRGSHQGSWLIKAVWEHGSMGIGEGSLVRRSASLPQALAAKRAELGARVFAEAYVEGREFNLALLAGPGGPRCLPPAEIVFDDFAPAQLRVVGYRAKWEADSFEYSHTPRCFSFGASDQWLLSELERLARACWPLFGLRGWARVDFRVDRLGRPWILEVNANPCLAADAGFVAAAAQAGLDQRAVVAAILADAIAPEVKASCTRPR